MHPNADLEIETLSSPVIVNAVHIKLIKIFKNPTRSKLLRTDLPIMNKIFQGLRIEVIFTIHSNEIILISQSRKGTIGERKMTDTFHS